jgi:hypothetical protein
MNLLILTSGVGLFSVYGEDGARTILSRARQVASSLPGTSLQVLAPSQTGNLLLSAGPPGALALYAELKTFITRSAIMPDTTCLLIVGDQRVFPSFQTANPVGDRILDPDDFILTDNPYGEFDWQQPSQCVLPPYAVGRIAPGVSDSAADVCGLLDSLIALRQRPTRRTGYVEIASRQWQDASGSVLSMIAPSARVIISPDGRVSASNAAVLDCKFLYCNLHGFVNESAWSGYDNGLSWPVPALTPDAFQTQFVSGTIVFTEACYGLAISGKRTTSSNALSLLSAGAAAVIGSTGLAFGTADIKPQNLVDADVLARSFFLSAINSGHTVGQSLLQARQALRSTAPITDPYLVKTLLEFQLLGDPSYEIF